MATIRELIRMQGQMAGRLAELKRTLPKDTYIERECMYCHRILGKKPGHGVTGKTSTICHACLEIHHPEYAVVVKALRQAA